MKVCSYNAVPAERVTMEGVSGKVNVRVLIGDADGAPNFVMRHFELEPGSSTPHHHHPYEHEVFILEGEGIVLEGERERPFRAGDCIYVPADETHQFKNTSSGPIRFLCLIPRPQKCTG